MAHFRYKYELRKTLLQSTAQTAKHHYFRSYSLRHSGHCDALDLKTPPSPVRIRAYIRTHNLRKLREEPPSERTPDDYVRPVCPSTS